MRELQLHVGLQLQLSWSRCNALPPAGTFGRPTYMSADLYFTGIPLSSFFILFRNVPSELGERNSTKIGHMVGSECDLKTHVRNLG